LQNFAVIAMGGLLSVTSSMWVIKMEPFA